MSEQQRVVLITGGTGALGAAVTRHFASAGLRTHATWRSAGEVERFRDSGGTLTDQISFHHADVASAESVAGLFAEIDAAEGRLDVLANIAGGFAAASLADSDPELWTKMIAINATSAFLCCREAARLMARQQSGSIINVASLPAVHGGAANMSVYAAAKAAVLNLTQSLASELRGDGITVNAIVPTIIDTPANRRAMPNADTTAWLNPDDIAKVIGFLAGADARIVSGTAMILSGG